MVALKRLPAPCSPINIIITVFVIPIIAFAEALQEPGASTWSSVGLETAPELMQRLVQNAATADGIAPHGASVVRCFVETAPSEDLHFRFNVSGLEEAESVLEAEFRVFRLRNSPKSRRSSKTSREDTGYLVRLYQVMPGRASASADVHRLLGVQHVEARAWARTSQWLVFNAKEAVLSWAQGEPNLGLLLAASTLRGEPKRMRVSRRPHHAHARQPVLVLYDTDGAMTTTRPNAGSSPSLWRHLNAPILKKVDRRSDEEGDEGEIEDEGDDTEEEGGGRRVSRSTSSAERCERRSMWVNLTQLGWSDAIIAPQGFDAFHCQGQCQAPLEPTALPSNHAVLQSLVHELRTHTHVRPPCCVPQALHGLGVLHYDQSFNIVYRIFEDMVVESCGCR